MVIGVDAGALSTSDPRLQVGVYKVIKHLLTELSIIDTNNSYRLYSFETISNDVLTGFSSSMTNLVLKPQKGWFSWRLPLSLLLHPVDLFFGVSQGVPLSFSHNIVMVHDLGFLHNPEFYTQSASRLTRQTREAVRRAEMILCISESTKLDIMETYHIEEKNIIVANPGIDETFSPHGDKYNSKTPYLLHVGSLKPSKNIPRLIQAFSQFLHTSKKEYLLLLIGGDYWLDPQILPTITACGLEDKVRLLGHVPDSVLKEYYRGAAAFTTLTLTEGFCLPVIEAMASGIPVIGSDIPALREIVPDQTLLADANNFAAFSQNLIRVLDDNEYKTIVTAKGLAKAQQYTWNAFAQKVYSVIQRYES